MSQKMIFFSHGTYIFNGNSELVKQVRRKTDFLKMSIEFATSFDLNKCLKQIKLPISLFTCQSSSESPSNLNIMISSNFFFKKKVIALV